jgi:hypothetical protein
MWVALLLNLICGVVVTIWATLNTDAEVWGLGLLFNTTLAIIIAGPRNCRPASWPPFEYLPLLAAFSTPFCMIFLGVTVDEPDDARALLWLVLVCMAALVVAELWTLATAKENDGGPTETIDNPTETIDNPTGSETSRTNARVEVVEVDEQGREIAAATGDPEIASQDSAAAGYAPPPPPGASIVRVAFARACVAAIIDMTPAVAIHSAKRPPATTTEVRLRALGRLMPFVRSDRLPRRYLVPLSAFIQTQRQNETMLVFPASTVLTSDHPGGGCDRRGERRRGQRAL